MKPAFLGLTALVLGGAFLPAWSADLQNIDRTISKEPKYASKPHYALLVFGPGAEHRVWLVVDGKVLYVDRNGNGDLTEPNERVEMDIEASSKNKVVPGAYKGMNVFNIGEVMKTHLRLEVWVPDGDFVPRDEGYKKILNERSDNGWEVASLLRMGKEDVAAQNPILFCRTPKDAQITHFKGPLTFALRLGEHQTIKRVEADTEFHVCIGTRGLATRNSSYPVFAPLTTTEVPADLHPEATFVFPHRDPNKPPIQVAVVLNRRC